MTRNRLPDAFRPARLILAAKAATAAAVAWMLAPYVPFAASEYSYYAPLGVLVSMYPTVAGSARAGVQSLAGLGLGIGVGLGGLSLVIAGAPAVLAVAAVIGVGIFVGGIRALGYGRDWVPIAALFVLLVGGPDADRFSLSYLLTMAFGVLIGVLTNLLIVPPLYLRRASERLTALRDAVCTALRDVAATLEDEPVDTTRTHESSSELPDLLATVEEEVRVAEESSRGNPRSLRRGAERRLNARRLHALRDTTRATVELTDVLASLGGEGVAPDAETRAALADAIRECADLVAAPARDPRAEDRLTAAADALDRVSVELDRVSAAPWGKGSSSRASAWTATMWVRRIVDASREFVAATAAR